MYSDSPFYFRAFDGMKKELIGEDFKHRKAYGPIFNESTGDFDIELELITTTTIESLNDFMVESVPGYFREELNSNGFDPNSCLIFGRSIVSIQLVNEISGWLNRNITRARREYEHFIQENIPGLQILIALELEYKKARDRSAQTSFEHDWDCLKKQYDRASFYLEIMGITNRPDQYSVRRITAAKRAMILLEKGASIEEAQECLSKWISDPVL